jgi:hypothetical protein
MGSDSKTWRRLEALARAVNDHNPGRAVEVVRRVVGETVETTAVRVFDKIVSRLAGTPVSTVARARTPVPSPAAPGPAPGPDAARVDDTPAVAHPPAPDPAPEPEVVAEVEAATPAPSEPPAAAAAPKRFGIDRVVLLIRNPERAFAYWEISADRLASAGATESVAELRLVDADSGDVVARAPVAAAQGRHYFDVPDASRTYVAELVLCAADAQDKLLSRSSRAASPSAGSDQHPQTQ